MILRAGPITALFKDGDLRYIRHGGKEIISRIYFALRDSSWATALNTIENLEIGHEDGGFRVTFDALSKVESAEFQWSCIIVGTASGVVEYSFSGRALTSFQRNRLGLCVLHPTGVWAGKPCHVETDDGRTLRGTFPKEVSPHQPFFNIRAITHWLTPNISANLRFSGDEFEMEDQRNWTDATYKTYSTPLRLPIPVDVPEGTEVHQGVTFHLQESPSISITEMPESCLLPQIGVELGQQSSDSDYVSVALNFANASPASVWSDVLTRAGGKPLECILNAASDQQLAELSAAMSQQPGVVCRWLVYPETLVGAVRRQLAPASPVLTGSLDNFAGLNRNRPRMDNIDGVFFPINPQVHALDDWTVVENLAAQQEVLKSAQTLAASKLVAVHQVTFKVPPSRDLLHAWTLLSIKNLALGGTTSVTFSKLTAIADVFPEIAEFLGGEVIACLSSDPRSADALILRKGLRTRVFLVNFAEVETAVIYNGQSYSLKPRTIERLDFGEAQ